MLVDAATDELGDYLAVTCRDGRTFKIDAVDAALLEGRPWAIYNSRGYEACKYVVRSLWIDGVAKTETLHRLIMDAPKGITVDHIDWDTLNNRRYNLRLATVHQNHSHVRWERGGRGRLPTSGFRGAYRNAEGQWFSMISWHNKPKYLGTFPSAVDAARAWDAAARELRGEFTYQNFPEGGF